MRRSLRAQLLARIAVTTLVIFSVAAATTFILIRKSLLEEFDTLLDAKVHALAKLVEQDHDKLRIEFAEHHLHEFVRDVLPEYYEVWDEKGVPISRSPHLASHDLLDDPNISGDITFRFLNLPDGRQGRVAAIRFVPIVDDESLLAKERDAKKRADADESPNADSDPLQKMTLALASGTNAIYQTVDRLAWIIFVASSAALILLLCALAWTVADALRPLKSLATQIAGVDANSLATRFDITLVPSEVIPVVARVNRLMSRLEHAFLQERTFSADIAHELRTPLAGIRSIMQVALSRPRARAEYLDAMIECERICTTMQRLVETLLSLARPEHDNSRAEWCYIDVRLLVTNCWKSLEEAARQRGLRVKFNGPEGIFLHSDGDRMRVVLSNLFDNAVAHANTNGEIAVSWRIDETGLMLQVANTGCQLNSEQMRHVFDRFWRGNSARSETGVHAGLGLSLCRKLVESIDSTISADCIQGSFVVILSFKKENLEIADYATYESQSVC
jgi:two-component system, OmpR family, heavy metal sensor histidine kinase CusS